MKLTAGSKRRDDCFQVGDVVFLKLQPYRQQSLARRPFDKLAARFFGPYEIIARVGSVAYRLELPPNHKIHPIFHISQLKRAHGSVFIPTSLPAHIHSDLVLEAEPEAVLGIRNCIHDDISNAEVLIQWSGLPSSDATWELGPEYLIAFPSLSP